MPNSSALWMAAGLLWILDASINISMEPFRAFVADMLPRGAAHARLRDAEPLHRPGRGRRLGAALDADERFRRGRERRRSTIPLNVKLSFYVGAVAFLGAVLWTIVTTKEYPPEDLEAFRRMKAESAGIAHGARRSSRRIAEMPADHAAAGLGAVLHLARPVLHVALLPRRGGAQRLRRARYEHRRSTRRASSGRASASPCTRRVCFAFSFVLPSVAARAAAAGAPTRLPGSAAALGLLSVAFIQRPSTCCCCRMTGVGIAWASILSMPYAMLAGALPAGQDGRLHGHLQLLHRDPRDPRVARLRLGDENLLGDNRLAAVMAGGVFLLLAALLVHAGAGRPQPDEPLRRRHDATASGQRLWRRSLLKQRRFCVASSVLCVSGLGRARRS